MSKETMIIVDTEVGFAQRFKKKLEEEGIEEKYEVINLSPNTSLPSKELIKEFLGQLKDHIQSIEKICGIFVDIVIYEREKLDAIGIELATSIKAQFPQIPTFNITRYIRDDKEADLLATASLENIDGALPKSYLEGETFSYSRLKNIFCKANQKISMAHQKRANFDIGKTGSTIVDDLSISYTYPDYRVKSQINEIGKHNLLSLLNKIFPDSGGTINYIKPGRSGAFVFKLKTKFKSKGKSKTRPKGWILKVAKNKELIDREVENYIDLSKSPLPKTAYPKMYRDKAFSFGELTGLVYELEEDSKTLIQYLDSKFSFKDIEILKNQISIILENIYGDSDKKIVNLWQDIYHLDDEVWNNITFFLQDKKQILINKVDDDTFKRVENLIKSEGKTEDQIFKFELEIDQRNIHGDFNSGNILINKNKNLILIDFGSIKQDHITKDIAKLERDIIYKVIDSLSSNYYDWGRIEVWKNFHELYNPKDFFECSITYIGENEKIKNYLLLIKSLRSILKTVSPQVSMKEYLFSVLYFTLLALIHPDISIHKKAYAIINIELILIQIESLD